MTDPTRDERAFLVRRHREVAVVLAGLLVGVGIVAALEDPFDDFGEPVMWETDELEVVPPDPFDGGDVPVPLPEGDDPAPLPPDTFPGGPDGLPVAPGDESHPTVPVVPLLP